MPSNRRVAVLVLASAVATAWMATFAVSGTASTSRDRGPGDDTHCHVLARNSTNDSMRRVEPTSKGRGDRWDPEPALTTGIGGVAWESVDPDGRVCSNTVSFRYLKLDSPCNYAEACVYTMKVSLTGQEAGLNATASCDTNNSYIQCHKIEEKVNKKDREVRIVWRLCRKGFACQP